MIEHKNEQAVKKITSRLQNVRMTYGSANYLLNQIKSLGPYRIYREFKGSHLTITIYKSDVIYMAFDVVMIVDCDFFRAKSSNHFMKESKPTIIDDKTDALRYLLDDKNPIMKESAKEWEKWEKARKMADLEFENLYDNLKPKIKTPFGDFRIHNPLVAEPFWLGGRIINKTKDNTMENRWNKEVEKLKADYNHKMLVMDNLIEGWGLARDLFRNVTAETQRNKGMEEIGEIFSGHNRGDKELVMDGIGDAYVCHFNYGEVGGIDSTMANRVDNVQDALDQVHDSFGTTHFTSVLEVIADHYGTTLLDCVKIAYEDIKDRKGKFIDGVYVKDEDLR